MAFYMDEEQAWKCRKHPSKRRRTGICPKCLHERLVTLCPNCATALPCACCPPPADSSSSSISSSSSSSTAFSLFSFSRGGSRHDFGTAKSNDLDVDPALRKSRSVAISFLRSRSRYVGNGNGNGNGNGVCEIEVAANGNKLLPPKVSRSKGNFWSIFTVNRSKKRDVHAEGAEDVDESPNPAMMRSRSVAVGAGNGIGPASSKQKGWYFPSPINAFRHSKTPRSVTVT
ncbi:hypothetical protein SSX86_009301 [Deinandra increscens subsp. villosa]|uniref:Uncharacterized protein n=1 Tax=Deinandra increscens subsp. villosa TaxID=3103831 RepID=A0AAP0DD11_9ASTR